MYYQPQQHMSSAHMGQIPQMPQMIQQVPQPQYIPTQNFIQQQIPTHYPTVPMVTTGQQPQQQNPIPSGPIQYAIPQQQQPIPSGPMHMAPMLQQQIPNYMLPTGQMGQPQIQYPGQQIQQMQYPGPMVPIAQMGQQQQHNMPPVFAQNAPPIDPRVYEQYKAFLAHATPGQMKPNKLYVVLGEQMCLMCLQKVRASSDLEKMVEVIDVSSRESRPPWLQGVPTLVETYTSKKFEGNEALQWLHYQSSQTPAGVQEITGLSQTGGGGPAAIDGASKLSGILANTSFVPQQLVSDRDILSMVGPGRASDRIDSFLQQRAQMPVILPPPQQIMINNNGQYLLPEQYRAQQVREQNQSQILDKNIEGVMNERNALLNMQRLPHYMGQMGPIGQQNLQQWNPIQTEHVQRQGYGDQTNFYLQQLEQQRNQVQVPIRPLL